MRKPACSSHPPLQPAVGAASPAAASGQPASDDDQPSLPEPAGLTEDDSTLVRLASEWARVAVRCTPHITQGQQAPHEQ